MGAGGGASTAGGDEVYGDFEDLETGIKHEAKDEGEELADKKEALKKK